MTLEGSFADNIESQVRSDSFCKKARWENLE